MHSNVTGVILTGGRSRRMGQHKAFLEWQGQTFISCLQSVLSSLFPENYISIADLDQKHMYENLKWPVVIDSPKFQGPLAGIHASLKVCSSDYIFVISCDMPLITKSMIEKMIECSINSSITIVEDLPLFGLYHVKVLEALEQQLEENNFKVWNFLNDYGYANVSMEEHKERLKNVNTWQEYQKLPNISL